MGIGLTNSLDVVSVTINPASVSANTTSEQTFTVPGVKVGDCVQVSKPSHTAGLVVSSARVSAVNTVAITFGNLTGSPIDAPSEAYLFQVVRPERVKTSFAV